MFLSIQQSCMLSFSQVQKIHISFHYSIAISLET